MSRHHFVRALLGASALAFAASAVPASAQQIDHIVAFGDSYADDGNLFQLVGIPYPAPYSSGRFSGGTNYIDTLAQILGVEVDNFAIGGALTNNTNTNGPGIPGFATEWNAFLAGGGPAAFPQVSGSFNETDLVTVSIGANDARFYQQNGGTLAGAAAAGTISAAQATAGLDALVGAGAPTISFLAGDTSQLAEIAGNPAAQQVRSAYSGAFNTAIQGSLAGYADEGVIVHYLDGNAVLNRIRSDPGAYGLTSTGPCPLAESTRCVTDRTFSDQYLFYVDALHLSSAGFAILGQYVAAQLDAPLSLQAPSDLGLDTARQFGRTLSSRADLYGPRAAGASAGVRFFLVGDAFQRDVEESLDNNGFDIDGVGVTAGAEFGLPGGVAGVAANYSRPRVRFGDDSSRVNGRSYQLGAYAGIGMGSMFAQGHIGVGTSKLRIRRTGVIDNLTARPDGSHVTAGAKAGYLMPFGPLRVGPVVALDVARAKVDGYTEDGDAALSLDVGKQSYKAMTGQIGVEARGSLDAGLAALRPFVSATLEHDFTGDDRTIAFSQTSAPVIVNRWDVAGEKQTYGRLSAGAAASILTGTSIDAAVTSTIGRDGGQELGAHLGLRIGF
ncbi:MAG TPA: autotransporter domain-containing protein [Sphingomicrobium sp.]|nr:autotransporter domain-containing protein [Sphingomicrobium sp.]